MGQKVNPISNRLGIIRGWDSNWYGGKNYGDSLLEDSKIRKYLNARLAKASVSRIVIERTLKLVTITVCTARPGIIIGKGGQEVDKLKEELKKVTDKDIQINIFEVKRPELDAVIVANNIARQVEGKIAYRRAIKMAIANTMRMGAEGIKIQISGRLNGAEMARSEMYKEGRTPLHTFRADIDYCHAEALTKVGLLGIKVWICRGEVYGCAADRQQASIVFEVAADMVRMCPALNKRVKILASQKRIVYQSTNSFYQVLSAEAYSKHGFNIHGVVFDELHTQPNRKLFDVMTKGSGDARTQPLYFLITTAGTDTNSICYETHQKAKDIIEGRKIDPTFYPVIYGAEETDDWTDPKVWKKANPSLGITVSIDKVQAACDSAKQNPGEENAFRQLRLNQWVKQAVRWMPMDKWDACNFHVNEDDLEGRVCYGGLDLSSTTDITAFVLVFPPMDEDDKFAILPYFWIPEDTLELRVRRDHVPYDIWERQGFLQTTEGNVVHYGYIEKFIEQLGERFNIREIAFDRWGAVQMVQNLEGMEFTVVPFGQGFKDMSPPTKELMKLTLEQKLAHGGHPVLRWMMDNIFIRTDPAGNIKADKEKSTEKIDGAIATIIGLDRAIRCGNMNTESVYDARGILFI